MLLFFRNETGFGGNNGFTDFKRILGHARLPRTSMRMTLFVTDRAAVLLGFFLLGALAGQQQVWPGAASRARCRKRVSCSAATTRMRFQAHHLDHLGHDVRRGRRAVCARRWASSTPSEMSPANSIEIAIWAAVGGRATLIGPMVGAFIVNGAKSWLTVSLPRVLAVLSWARCSLCVTLFLPRWSGGLDQETSRRQGSKAHDSRSVGSKANSAFRRT